MISAQINKQGIECTKSSSLRAWKTLKKFKGRVLELTVLIFILCLMPCNPIVIASCWDYLCFLLKFPFTDPFLGHKVYWMIKVLFTKALINQEEPKVSCDADKMLVFFQLPFCKENHFNKHFQNQNCWSIKRLRDFGS